MEELDGDVIRLTNSRGQEAERDIVQVRIKQFLVDLFTHEWRS